jgi:predicted LPLAT superfamily acyltransferase
VRPSPHIEVITARPMAFIGDETASLRSRLPLKEWSSIMRHLFKQTEPLQDRVAAFSREVKAKAARLPPGKEKDNLLRRARLADMASQLDDWANSPGLQPPK